MSASQVILSDPIRHRPVSDSRPSPISPAEAASLVEAFDFSGSPAVAAFAGDEFGESLYSYAIARFRWSAIRLLASEAAGAYAYSGALEFKEDRGLADDWAYFQVAHHLSRVGATEWQVPGTSSVRQPEGLYGARIRELATLAREEGITPSHESRLNFLEFVEKVTFPLRKGALFLLDDGAYHATWRDEQWRLDLGFPGGRKVAYVLLERADLSKGVSGTVDFEEFGAICERHSLESLLAG